MAPSVAEPTTREGLSDQDWRFPNPTTTLPPSATLSEALQGPFKTWTDKGDGVKLVVEFISDPPVWARPTIQALQELLLLRSDWDTYGALPVDPRCVTAAIELALEAFQDDTPPPSVVPTSRGGVQLEWHTAGVDLEVEFLSLTRICGLFEDHTNGVSWEEHLTSDLQPLIEAIARLSQER